MLSLRKVVLGLVVVTDSTRMVRAADNFDIITCYGYNGKAHANNTRCPGSDACCGVDSTCFSNRLCKKPKDNFFVRGPCAVESWRSGQCAQLCRYNETQVFPRVTVCLDGSYCCDQDGAQCCSDKRGVFLDVTGNIAKVPASTTMSWGPERTSSGYQTVATTSATSINTSDVSTASTPAVSASSTSSPGATSQSESSNAAKIGAGVGVPVGVIAIGGVAALVILWRRKKRQTRFRNASELDSEGHHQEMVGRKPSAPTPPELEDRQVHRSELSA